MKTRNLLFVFLLISNIYPVSAGAQGPGQGIKEIVSQVRSCFPILELYVISVEDNKIILEKDKAGKIRPGMELHLFREGKEFTHPVTGKALGRFEESLGNLRVLSVKENYAEGEIISLEKGAVIQRGDKARITATKIELAVFQIINLSSKEIDEESLTYQLIDGLEETNRFEIAQMGELITALDELKITDYTQLADPQVAQKLGQILGIRGIVATQLKEINDKLILEARLLSAYTGDPISKTTIALSGLQLDYSGKEQKAMPSPLTSKEKKLNLSRGKDIFKSQGLDMSIRSLAVGDITGNGKNEIAVTDGKQVTVFSLDGTRLVKLWGEPQHKYNQLAVDIADINHNGTAEIFVTNRSQTKLHSYILEYINGEYKKISDNLNYFLRVLELEDGPHLIGQRSGVSQAFYGDLSCLEYNAGQYTANRKLKVPAGVSIYGFTIGDVNNDGKIEIVQIDNFDRLRVYSPDGELQWKSSEHYGGYNFFFSYTPRNVFTVGTSSDKPNRVNVKGRIFIQDIDGNGTNEILISKNIPEAGYLFSTVSNYTQGRVVDLEWDGIGYGENWQTKKFDAYVADFGIADLDNDQRKDLVMALVVRKRGLSKSFRKEQSFIIFYQL
jgi:hypothetical protein